MTFEVVLLIGYFVQLIAFVGLLFNIWYNQHCKGLSVKSQILYTLVFTTRHLDLVEQCPLNADTAFKVAFTTMTWGTLLSMIVFRKTYQKKNDTFRIEILIIPCIVMAVLVNHDSSILGIFNTFSIYLEAVAMVPQFQFLATAKHIHPSAFYYVNAVGVSKALVSVYWSHEDYYGKENLNLRVASNMVQLVFFCDFFFRVIILGMCCRKNKIPRAVVATTQTDVENGIPGTGHLANNVCTVLLRPRVTNEDGNNRFWTMEWIHDTFEEDEYLNFLDECQKYAKECSVTRDRKKLS